MERVQGIRVPDFVDHEVVLYIESLYAPTIARQLGLKLLDTPENWLPSVPAEYRRRSVELTTLAEARERTFPAFVKPPNEKSFAARVYETAESLPTDYAPETPVL